jgi:hypothetical protein
MTLNRFEIVSKRIVAKVVRGIFSLVRFLSDTATATDHVAKDVGKGINDTATASDVFTRVVEYNRSFDDAASAGDAVAKDISKALSDSATASDNFTRVVGYNRSFADTATQSDSGVVLNQDYVSGFYFADDYVGIKRTF